MKYLNADTGTKAQQRNTRPKWGHVTKNSDRPFLEEEVGRGEKFLKIIFTGELA